MSGNAPATPGLFDRSALHTASPGRHRRRTGPGVTRRSPAIALMLSPAGEPPGRLKP
jgi:hypothetical protein